MSLLVVGNQPNLVVVDGPTGPVVEITAPGPQGPQGIPGPAGGSTVQGVSGENLGGNRVVRVSDGLYYYADSSDVTHEGSVIGITIASSVMGESVDVQTLGEMVEPSWSFTDGPVYLGTSGTLTQTPPSGGFSLQIGVATSATSILINLTNSLILL